MRKVDYIKKKTRKQTIALAKLTLITAELHDLLAEEAEGAAEELDEFLREKLDEVLADKEQLEQQLAKLTVSHFPGDVELVVKTKEGLRAPTSDDLLTLCRSNGLVVLERGSFTCGNCGGIRTADHCNLCEVLARLKGVAQWTENTKYGFAASEVSKLLMKEET
jgi:tRNA G18 (ribose-2'-O)-methylase SpoU